MATQSKSWGHRIEPIPPEKQAQVTECGEVPSWAICARPKCRRIHCWYGFYRYATGRSGRVTERTLYLCQEHAEKFAADHGLTLESVS